MNTVKRIILTAAAIIGLSGFAFSASSDVTTGSDTRSGASETIDTGTSSGSDTGGATGGSTDTDTNYDSPEKGGATGGKTDTGPSNVPEKDMSAPSPDKPDYNWEKKEQPLTPEKKEPLQPSGSTDEKM